LRFALCTSVAGKAGSSPNWGYISEFKGLTARTPSWKVEESPTVGENFLSCLSDEVDVGKTFFLRFVDVSVRRIDFGRRDVVVALMLLAAALGLAAFVGGGCGFHQPGDIRNVNRFYHVHIIGRLALEL
jgi:hypothetical protein